VERKSERHTGAQFIHRLAIYPGMAQTHIEGEIVTYLPDGPDKHRIRLFHTEDTIGVHLENRSDRPFVRAFKDDVEK
jgi:hypothetical protein